MNETEGKMEKEKQEIKPLESAWIRICIKPLILKTLLSLLCATVSLKVKQ